METQGAIPFPYQVQPDRTIRENADGTLDATVDYVTRTEWFSLLPQVEDEHPDDKRLEIHTRELTRSGLDLVRMTAHFRGLRDDPTEPTISYVGSPDRERIETHPDFSSTLAGTGSGNALNGAEWIQESGYDRETFHGFTDTGEDLYGVEFYLKASTQITLTHWQTKVPTVERMKIVVPSALKPFKSPADVDDYLLLDTPYRQIGSLYQVSKIYLGSGSGGWSTLVYPQ